MAAIIRSSDPAAKLAKAAAKTAGFKAEQVRLKDLAASRREEAARANDGNGRGAGKGHR
jgi:hypothetical protein